VGCNTAHRWMLTTGEEEPHCYSIFDVLWMDVRKIVFWTMRWYLKGEVTKMMANTSPIHRSE